MKNYLSNYENNRQIISLVENRTVYTSEFAELSIFETRMPVKKVNLLFDYPIIASMLSGKKVMHFKDIPSFDFLPGESIIVPSNKELIIDFPIATEQSPTKCLALGIASEKIKDVTEKFIEQISIENEYIPLDFNLQTAHLTHQKEVDLLIKRMVNTFTGDSKTKDILLEIMMQELIVRLLQTKARYIFLKGNIAYYNDSRIGAAIKYIKEHLTEKNFSVDNLAKVAYMSTSHFYKQFKNTLGISPVEYINTERIKFAKKLLAQQKKRTISEIAYLSGFNNVSYFNRIFKKFEQISPGNYLKAIQKQEKTGYKNI